MEHCSKKVGHARQLQLYFMLTDVAGPFVPYVDYWEHLFNFSPNVSAELRAHANSCGYTCYIDDKYLTFPPPGPFPEARNDSDECRMWTGTRVAALDRNPYFDIYHILDTCPHPWNVLSIVN